MHEINTELAVKYLVEELSLKNEAELAEKLQMTKNALSMLKKRNSLGTLIEKVLTNIDANVSMDRLVYGYSSNCFRAQTLAIENQKEDELATILENFIDSQTIMIKLKTKIQRIKGQTFFEKLSNVVSGDGERMLVLLYSFLLHLEKTNLQAGTKDLDVKFHELLAQYEFSKLNTLKYGVWIKDKDLHALIDWAKDDLDTISMSEMIMTLPETKKFIKSQLYKIDKLTIELVEKYFS